MTAAHWTPDENLIEASESGSLSIGALVSTDRSWVVAGLTSRGLTAEETADRLRCSLRLVKQIRSDPMTAIAAYALGMRRQLDDARRQVIQERTSRSSLVASAQQEAQRYKAQRDELIGQVASFRRKQEARRIVAAVERKR